MERRAIAPRVITEDGEFQVLIVCPNGDEARIRHFGTFQDAQRWMEPESETWLRMRTQPPPPLRQRVIEDEGSVGL